MSHTSTKEPAPIHTTRQLLDELDALMERMLAVPVEDGANANEHPGEAAATPAVAATLTMVEPSDAQETDGDAYSSSRAATGAGELSADEPASFEDRPTGNRLFDDQPREQPAYQTANEHSQRLAAMPPYTAAQISDSPTPSVVEVIVPAPQPLTPLPARLRPSRSLGYQLLLWVNRGYDHGTFLLGIRARWLRSRMFRLGLGLAGAALFASALGWLVWDWFNWTN